MTDTVLRTRDLNSGNLNPDAQGAPLVLGTIGFLTYASAADTSGALCSAVDATAGHVFSENSIGGVTLSLTAGTIAVPRDGTYRLRLVLTNVTAASNSGVFSFAIQKNATALTNAKTIGWTNAAAVLPGLAATQETAVSLVKGDLIRCLLVSSVGGVVTIGSGSLSAQMIADASNPSQV